MWDNKGCAFFKLFQTAKNVITVVCLNYAAPPLKIAYIGSSWWNQAGLSFGLPTTSVKTLIQPWCTFSNVTFLPQETDDLTLRTCPTWLVFDWSRALSCVAFGSLGVSSVKGTFLFRTNKCIHVLSHRQRRGWRQRGRLGQKRGIFEWGNLNGSRKR